MSEPAGIVELRQAFVWTCDACGRDNFINGIVLDREAVAPMLAVSSVNEQLGAGVFMMAPDTVMCEHCQTVYRTEEP